MDGQAKEKKMTSKEQKEELKREKKVNHQIEKMLKQDKKRMESEVKLLLLGKVSFCCVPIPFVAYRTCLSHAGAGESGKSTIAKQMKILHLDGFTAKERKNHIPIIRNNAISAIQILIEATKTLNIPIEEVNKVSRNISTSLLTFKANR